VAVFLLTLSLLPETPIHLRKQATTGGGLAASPPGLPPHLAVHVPRSCANVVDESSPKCLSEEFLNHMNHL
jgi:hypothetical protein